MRNKYNVVWNYSYEDSAYVAYVPQLAYCFADGPTYSEMLENLDVVIDEWVEAAKEMGCSIPPPVKGKPKIRKFRQFIKSSNIPYPED